MFRISQYMHELLNPTPVGPSRQPLGPVVIWNLIRRCNLTCKHCYSISTDIDFPGELDTQQVSHVMDDLRAFHVPVLILSGGEPLMRPDIFDLSKYAKELGFYVALSTNGTLINESNIQQIAECDYQYVGISIDGIGPTHDEFRRKQGAFEASLAAVRLCRDAGVKTGLRYTPTQENVGELPLLLDLMKTEQVDKFYLSHLNYGGRGNSNRKKDVYHQASRDVMDQLFERAYEDAAAGSTREYVTGNNDADGVYMLQWIQQRFPDKVEHMRQKLVQWGGNSTGVNVANIDNIGNVHPDTFWWNYTLGNIKERPFSEIWSDTSDPLLAGLRAKPRPLGGRCGVCPSINICGGNTRVRAFQTTGDPWWEDPACYLSDEELGINEADYINEKPQTVDLKTHVVRRAG